MPIIQTLENQPFPTDASLVDVSPNVAPPIDPAQEAIRAMRDAGSLLGKLAMHASQPVFNTAEATHLDRVDEAERQASSERMNGQVVDSLGSFMNELPTASFYSFRKEGYVESHDVEAIRKAEATVWWVAVPTGKNYQPGLQDLAGKVFPMYAIGEQTIASDSNSDAKSRLLLASISPEDRFDKAKPQFCVATVSAVQKSRADELSIAKLVRPPTTKEVEADFKLHVEKETQAVRYTLNPKKLRTIEDPMIGGADLQHVPADEGKRAKYYEKLDASLEKHGMDSDNITGVEITPDVMREFNVAAYTAQLAGVFGATDAHDALLKTFAETNSI